MTTIRTLSGIAAPRAESFVLDANPAHSSFNAAMVIDSDSESILAFGPFCLSITERWLRKGNTPLSLSSRAFDILIALINRAGSIVSAQELFAIVWPDVVVEASNLRVHIVALRKALDDGKNGRRFVINVPGRGYMFVPQIRTISASRSAPLTLQPQHRLPTIPQTLFGRDKTVEKLSSLILSKRFVSVVGPGGVGKTTVSIAAASMLSPAFGVDGVFFLDLASFDDPTLGLARLLSIVSCLSDPIGTREAIVRCLKGKRILLVLDNCEHVVDSLAPLAARIFDEAPSVYLLATSREALRADGENVELLKPLDHAPKSSTSPDHSPAAQLFLERAAAGGGPSLGGDAEAAVVGEICRHLDGLPIAIELVASRVGTLGLLGIAELIEQDAVLMLRGGRSVLPRHQTLEALVEWSFNLLRTEEKELLMNLSAFEGAFTLEAIRSLHGQSDTDITRTANALAGLVDRSLVQVSRAGTEPSYRLLHITRAYCAHKRSRATDGIRQMMRQMADPRCMQRVRSTLLPVSAMVAPNRSDLSTALEVH